VTAVSGRYRTAARACIQLANISERFCQDVDHALTCLALALSLADSIMDLSILRECMSRVSDLADKRGLRDGEVEDVFRMVRINTDFTKLLSPSFLADLQMNRPGGDTSPGFQTS
jgi:hypothetical protein